MRVELAGLDTGSGGAAAPGQALDAVLLVRDDALDARREPAGGPPPVVEPRLAEPLRPAASAAVRLALEEPAADVGAVPDLLLVEHAVVVIERGDHGDAGVAGTGRAAHVDGLDRRPAVACGAVLQVDGEGPVVAPSDAAGVDELAGPAHGARHQGDAVAADDEDAVGASRRVLALTRRGSCGPRTRFRVLGLAACDRPYRTGVRACGGRPPRAVPGVVICRRMQRPELALRRHPRYPGVRFMDRCHCCCSLTWVQPAGRVSVQLGKSN